MNSHETICYNAITEVICEVKSIKKSTINPELYLSKDLGFDSIAIVDLWFELKKLLNHKFEASAFFTHLRSQSGSTIKNDFQIQSLIEYLTPKN